jgi:serine/threonine-protein phosphatase 5
VVGTIYSDKKKYKEAVGYFTNAIKIDSLNTDYYSHRAETYVKLNDFKDALADDNKAITIDSTLPDIYLHRSIVLFQLGEFVKARTDLKKAADHGGYATEEFIKVLSDSLTKKHL